MAADKYVDRFPASKGAARIWRSPKGGKSIVTVAQRDGMVRIWDFESRKVQRSFQAVPDSPCRMVLSPDGKTLAVSYHPVDDGTLGPPRPRPSRLWDLATGKELHTTRGRLWRHGVFTRRPTAHYGHRECLGDGHLETGCDIPGRRTIAYLARRPLSRSNRFRRHDRSLGHDNVGQNKEFKGHRDSPTVLAFTPGGQLLSGSADTTVLSWHVR